MKKYIDCKVALLIASVFFITSAYAAPSTTRQTWTVKEILKERDLTTLDKKQPRYCQGERFKPCVCASNVTKSVQYRPSVRECGRRAAVILSKRYLTAFSAVVRDRENRDRWPLQGANGCAAYERDVLGLNKCSVFKVQKIIQIEDNKGDAELHCLGASGYSSLFRKVSRITIKLQDDPTSNQDPLVRLCLAGPDKPLN
jgi:hypothetical protein